MNRKVLQNKAFLMSHSLERKKMYKSGKQWVVAGALFLALLGGSAVAGHASTKPVANQPASNASQQIPKAIQHSNRTVISHLVQLILKMLVIKQ